MPSDHAVFIRDRWPDKALFANVLLLVAGTLGFLHAFVAKIDGITFASAQLAFIESYPWWATAALSLVAVAAAMASMRTRDLRWAALGAVCGFASFGLVLVEPMLSTVAMAFLVRARFEGEDTDEAQRGLTALQWPDKTLAASALLLMAGTATLEWWVGIVFGFLHAQGLSELSPWMGLVGLTLGLVAVFGSHALYHQRQLAVCVVAALAGVAGVGLFVVAPMLSLAALVLIVLGVREDEFGRKVAPSPA